MSGYQDLGIAWTGVPSLQELRQCPGYPGDEALLRGPKAVIECFQEIPCNPCEKACPRGAITVGKPITNLPRLDAAKCTGCGLCIPACPGLAIFVVNAGYAPGLATVSFPWEFLPYPSPGDEVVACDRSGRPLCKGKVLKVQCPPRYEKTAVVTLVVPAERADAVRGIVRGRPGSGGDGVAHTRGETADEGCQRDPFTSKVPTLDPAFGRREEEVVLCRCEEVTRGEVWEAIREGARTVSDIRRRTRAGMGLCQGTTCRRLVAGELRRAMECSPGEVVPERARPPVRPVALGVWQALDEAGGLGDDAARGT